VPSDVKDAVAQEVVKFITRIIPEENCDALCLCTSRPQGYSGQFQALGASVVELIDLSREEAIQCATPLLTYGRNQAEAKNSTSIIHQAIKQPAVANLMQTPLQCHIMAVIVRSGQKPPERRWKLFSNFYDVILNREVAKKSGSDFVYKLLTTEDSLLRAVHNRLGFVLHARAEKSVGATTNLSRVDFAELVHTAVDQMSDPSELSLAEGLVEAATERLVLVNTPDSGESVRFDVRQLQEFFAGEFIYQSATISQIRKRLEVLAGDPHWREVIHFTMAAFIEQSRVDELIASCALLGDLDEGSDGIPTILARRMGRGAITTFHLSGDGLLEQDKRIRQRFGVVLRNATYSLSAGYLAKTVRAGGTTYIWIRDTMFEILAEVNQAEAWGALVVLISMMEDNDPELPKLLLALENLSNKEISILFEKQFFAPHLEGVGRKWIIVFLCRWLARAPTAEIGESYMYMLPRMMLNVTPEDNSALSNILGSIWFFFSSFARLTYTNGIELDDTRVSPFCGPARLRALSVNQMAEVKRLYSGVLPLDVSEVKNGSCLYDLWMGIQSLRDEKAFEYASSKFQHTGGRYIGWFPWFFHFFNCFQREGEAPRALQDNLLGGEWIHFGEGKWSLEDFKQLLALKPREAISLCFGRAEYLQTVYPEARMSLYEEIVANWLIDNPQEMGMCFPAWGKICDLVGLSHDIFLQRFSSNIVNGDGAAFVFYPIKLRAVDSAFLPSMFFAAYSAFESLRRNNENGDKFISIIVEAVGALSLPTIATSINANTTTRIAALGIMFLVNSPGVEMLLVQQKADVFSDELIVRLINSILWWAETHGPAYARIEEALVFFFNNRQLGLHLRSELEPIVSRLLETSRFPAYNMKLEHSWLREET
jgi:hypothetical protein